MHRPIHVVSGLISFILLGCATAPASKPATEAPPASLRSIALPGATPDGVSMDYLAYDRTHHRVWVPAGNTGSVDVVDATNDQVTRIEGFPTTQIERKGVKRTVGPSSATVGPGVVFVGNRGDNSVCAIDAGSLKKVNCVQLASMPDGLAYVAVTKEVWATTPRDKTITVVNASIPAGLSVAGTIRLDGEPEGYAVDDGRGVFYTNLEDKDRTLAIDLKTRSVVRTWMPECGEDGPKGLALDRAMNFLVVACSARVEVLDAGHEGKRLSSVDTGDGIDNIEYLEGRHELFAAAAKAAKLTVVKLDSQGALVATAVVPTAPRARNPVATDDGVAFLTDSPEGKLLVVMPSHP
jgi:DNA-binding beta-propeller fold protein YncE